MATQTAPPERGSSGSTSRWLVVALCGCAGPLVAVGTDAAASALRSGHDADSRSASDLTAMGAPNRPSILAVLLTSDALVVVFGLGVAVAAAAAARHYRRRSA